MRQAVPAPFLPTIAKLTAEARATIAAELFAIDTVREAMTRAACLGRDRLFIRPGTPLDLRSTAAAVALVDHLIGVGAETFWHPYTVDQDGRPTTGYELEIGWNKAR